MLHRKLALLDIHQVHNWRVANIAARNALVLVLEDEGKVCFVDSDAGFRSMYVLMNATGPVWFKLSPDAGVVNMELLNTITIASGDYTVLGAISDYHTLTLTANGSLAMGTVTNCRSVMIRIIQDAVTARTLSWPVSFKWEGAAPVISTALGAVDILAITTFDAGVEWQATLSKGRA